ncbi:hypothetical protein QO010_001567 [Caulobacter ginsengisoli]|uniref:Uncharacterized protein n=1 Tax=Caulobacter ginsengisoli TaxID=400775 RepID=A0ABU0IP58_9CAUL|nr:hypothetical protein [Caulobacter ginsengisoli]MDQ0463796.1 hypothetical protein [Caulobacter ginsengisoli]
MRLAILPITALIFAAPALAQADSVTNYSTASDQSAQAVSAFAEAGVKTVAGVVALPLMVAAGGSAAVGSTAQGVGDSSMALADGTSQAGSDAADFSGQPLTVTDRVVLAPQPAPVVPYEVQKPK